MLGDVFSNAAVDALQNYVYRLIDPRNGDTFYVGRGRGQRVFHHVQGAISALSADDLVNAVDGDDADPKVSRINQIRVQGLEVQHVIHRYGMDLNTAKEVEAALIDAYPGLTNRMGGAGSNARGVRHVREIIREYDAEEFELDQSLIMISVGKSYEERGIYEAVRGVWDMRMERAKDYCLVLARVGGFVVGAYSVTGWLRWGPGLFPFDPDGPKTRIGFEGVPAAQDVWDRYVGKRVPAGLLSRGAQRAFRYLDFKPDEITHDEDDGTPVERATLA